MREFLAVSSITLHTALGLLFFASAVSKFLRPRSIRHTVENYRLLPAFAVPWFARMLAPVELAAGILLLLSPWFPVQFLAWALASGLLILFSLAIGAALARGLEIPCGCGLFLNGQVITRATLWRNLLLLVLLGFSAMMTTPPT